MPSLWEAQVGRVTLSVQVTAVLPLWALCVVARLKAPDCQVEPVQEKLSEPRWSVNVVLLAFTPTPVLLSATLPPKVAGTLTVRKALPPAGVVTEAVIGGVMSYVTVLSL